MKVFTYTATVKLIHENKQIEMFGSRYPGVADMVVSSREFNNYNDCLISCTSFINDLHDMIKAMGLSKTFRVSSETNPALNGGKATLSGDWSNIEISRLWLFDVATEGTGKISAAAQARIFSTEAQQVLMN